ncbi:MAG: alpha/beta fold hydrolase [Deltaproteobacteria bacterium]|nr:alpha/beta fold hydrolase [Candidatus Anaeroferrophillus wilburensis]MBN2890204.1 alpha/beta fold hydrolase [Deltaproteobacteria bacterium]
MGTPLVCFSHGKESGPWGIKIRQLAAIARLAGFEVESIDYRGLDDPDVRVEKLLEQRSTEDDALLVLAGSSMGGYVAAVAAETLKPAGLFLMAPAIAIPGFGRNQDPVPAAGQTAIIHGWHDEIIPPALIIDYAGRHALPLHLLDDSHRLVTVLPAVEQQFALFLQNILRRDKQR